MFFGYYAENKNINNNRSSFSEKRLRSNNLTSIFHQKLECSIDSPSILINDGQRSIFVVAPVLVKSTLVKHLITNIMKIQVNNNTSFKL